jgi:pyruvate dehydrogenase complex dehydrogenase (E1) component
VQAGREEEEGFVVKDNDRRITHIEALTKKALWLSNWMIHHANHIRPNVDGVKVGGHQASSASMAAIMSALYFGVLRPEDRVAVKPHAAPVFHAIQYLLGKQTLEKLIDFRAFGGAQSYPSRTKDADDVDFSTGSVGLGVAFTAFASLIQDYVRAKTWADTTRPEGRMVALVGDAELDEGMSTNASSRAGNTACVTPGGLSTTTARASMAWCARGSTTGLKPFSAPSIGTSSRLNMGPCNAPLSPSRAGRD